MGYIFLLLNIAATICGKGVTLGSVKDVYTVSLLIIFLLYIYITYVGNLFERDL